MPHTHTHTHTTHTHTHHTHTHTHTPQFSSNDNGHRMLDDFCSWQQSLKEDGGARFDMAVMVTKNEICEANGLNCGTLGEL